jgi:hypothetical protein
MMNVLGIDFTSRPSRTKPITCVRCDFDDVMLRFVASERWPSFSLFERELQGQGAWIAGVDFPFGQSRRFVENIGWPLNWRECVLHAGSLGRSGFRETLNVYRQGRPEGDREHQRKTDFVARSISPQKLYGVPVGLMFFEGAPRLAESGVTIPALQIGDPDRIVVEAYHGVLVRRIVGRHSYKHDSKKKQTPELLATRRDILSRLSEGAAKEHYGFGVSAPEKLCDDPSGDDLDALLFAIQAAWAWKNRQSDFGAPRDVDPLEGWIADPMLSTTAT